MLIDARITAEIAQQPYPLLFVTISGAHLYGFPSPDSDVDLRGAHIVPARQVLGLYSPNDTVTVTREQQGLKFDIVTHDVQKFFLLMLKRNGYVLEQLESPLVVYTTPEHEELKAIARNCITRYHYHHYLGFAQNQWQLLEKEQPYRVKPLLYVYRVLLTGIHLARTGLVEANLIKLNEIFNLPYLQELIDLKTRGSENTTITDSDLPWHRQEFERLIKILEDAGATSSLPRTPTAKPALNDLLVRLRLHTVNVSKDL